MGTNAHQVCQRNWLEIKNTAADKPYSNMLVKQTIKFEYYSEFCPTHHLCSYFESFTHSLSAPQAAYGCSEACKARPHRRKRLHQPQWTAVAAAYSRHVWPLAECQNRSGVSVAEADSSTVLDRSVQGSGHQCSGIRRSDTRVRVQYIVL